MPMMPSYHRPWALGRKADVSKARDQRRGSSFERGYDRRWLRASRGFRRKNPLCCCCYANGIVSAAQVTDHVVPHRGDKALFWDEANWQSLCEQCHNKIKKVIEGQFDAGRATADELRLDRPLPQFFDRSEALSPGGGGNL